MNKRFQLRFLMSCALCVVALNVQAQIRVTAARIGCLDSPSANQGNLTPLVARACENQLSCSYRAPTPQEYTRAGVRASTRTFCTQAMEITYHCGSGPAKDVIVPGDAWNQPPAQLSCPPPLLQNAVKPPAPNPRMAPALRGILERYKGCILEQYETQQDLQHRGVSAGLSQITSTSGLQARDITTCAAGNQCSLASRRQLYGQLLDQANRGDPANFQTKLQSAVPADCFQCAQHQERHTRHVHCTMFCGGNFGLVQGPCFEGCKAPDSISKLLNDIATDFSVFSRDLSHTTW